MLKMSFYDGTMKRDELINFIKDTAKPIKYTYGLGYRSPRINHVPITKEKAIAIVENEGLLDADEFEDYLHLNAYSSNDMW